MIVKAVNQLDGREGTREEIIAKVEQNYPPITKNISLMRTLDQAFSKHLQIQPARIKLVTIQQEEQPFSQEDAIQGGFCLKNAIIDCLDSSVVSLSTFMVAFSPDDGVKLTVTDWENLGK